MLFSSNIFLFLFLPFVLLVYYGLRGITARNIFLLLVSLLFYGWGEPRFVFVMIASILLNYVSAMGISRLPARSRGAKAWLATAVILNLGVLFGYKYLNFTMDNLRRLLPEAGLPVTSVVLPIGISFFMFQGLSYVIDVYRGDVQVQRNPLYVALYVSFFPQLIAGPIVRYRTIAAQINERTVTRNGFSEGVRRFLIGLGKKVILANALALAADEAFALAGTPQLSVAFAWVGIFSYAFQIYYDFSGYSDMAIGMGLMFGFHFDENFNYPYVSASISEFWRRWHISLGTWFRDYVYFPLGGSRVKTRGRLLWNLFVVWLLTGMWHGASWNFVVWGLMYFVLIAFEKLTGIPDRFRHPLPKALYRGFAMLCVLCGWVIFRASSLRTGLSYMGSMMGLAGNAFSDGLAALYLRENAVFLVAAALCAVPTFGWLKRRLRLGENVYEAIAAPAYLGVFLLCISYLVVGGHNPFIYFNF